MENEDIKIMGFGSETDAMVTSLAAKNRKEGKKTVVVMNIPGAIIMPWKDQVDAIIVDFFGGEKVSQALVDVIEGKVNPSGKLPITFPNK
jgi:beta-glucosidase